MTLPKTILCSTDFSIVSDRGLALAIGMAARFGSRLVIHHNLEILPPLFLVAPEMMSRSVLELEEERELQAEKQLREQLALLPAGVSGEVRLTTGLPDTEILELASNLPADLIVMATHARSGFSHFLKGSVTARVLQHSPCPVLTLHDDRQYSAISPLVAGDASPVALVPIDFSRQSRATLDFAVGLARGIDIKLHLLHVIDPVSWDDFRGSGSLNYIDYRDFCADLTRRRLASLMPPDLLGRAEVTVCAGSAAEEIPRHAVAIGASVIILGVDPKGRSDAAGAPPIAILQKSPCPILVVPESAKAASRTHAPAELAAAH